MFVINVFALDKGFKYKNTLFDFIIGLNKPAAIGVLNERVWITDGN